MSETHTEPDALRGGDAREENEDLYSKFARLFDTAVTYVDTTYIPGLREALAPFRATKPSREEFFSLPNAISLTGFLLVVDGARNITTKEGVRNIAIGRGLDVVDGVAARLLHQTSDFGALVDAGLDKLGLAVIAFEAARQRALPPEILASMAANQSASAVINYMQQYQQSDTKCRPSPLGKLSMAAEMSAVVGLLWQGACEREAGVERPNLRKSPAYKAMIGAELLRAIAVVDYWRRARPTTAQQVDLGPIAA